MSDLDMNVGSANLYRKGSQVATGRGADRLAGAKVEERVVPGAFDGMIHHKAVARMHLLVAAQAIGGKEITVGRVIDAEGLPAMVKAVQVFAVDVGGGAGKGRGGQGSPDG